MSTNENKTVLWHPTRAAYNLFREGLIDAEVPRFILEVREHEAPGYPVDAVIVTVPYRAGEDPFAYDELIGELMNKVGDGIFDFDGTDRSCGPGDGTRSYYYYPAPAMADAEPQPSSAYLPTKQASAS